MAASQVSARGLVGRAAERRALLGALEATAEGTPCAVVVHGEAGVGKTRLVRAVLDSASAELDADVLWGTCVQFGASTVRFAPMLRALRNVLPQATDSSLRCACCR